MVVKKKKTEKTHRVEPVGAQGQYALDYRPNRIEDMIVGNPEILGEVQEGLKLTQAWLITGETGVGKTTLARAIAIAINGNEAGIIEPDSTKTGIDDIRELIARIRFSPPGKKWIVIFDEVHKMSKAGFTGMLKLLENPPHKKVVFVLGTNHAQSVPPEIKRRCQLVEIEKPDFKQAYPLLKRILRENGVKASNEDFAKLVRKALTAANFGLGQALQYIQSYRNKIVSGTSIEKVISGSSSDTANGDSNIGDVERSSGSLLLALFNAVDNRKASIEFIVAEMSKVDVIAVVSRAAGILYHGTSLKVGGKWNWQSKPFNDILKASKTKPGLSASLQILDVLTTLVNTLNTTNDDMKPIVASVALYKAVMEQGKHD